MSINIDRLQFRHFLQHLAKENVTIKLKDQKLVALVGKGLEEIKDNSFTTAQQVCQFLENNQDNLNKTDVQILKKLQVKLLEGISDAESKNKIEEIFTKLVKIAENPAKTSVKIPIPQKETLILVSPPPKSAEELAANLSLIFSQYPKYQLGNDLEVIDATYGRLPKNLNREKIRLALDLFQDKPEKMDSLKEAIGAARNLYKTIKPVKAEIVIEQSLGGDQNGSMYDTVDRDLESKLPVIMTNTLLHCHMNQFEKLLQDQDVYTLKGGGFLLILPRGVDPISLGFDLKNLELWSQRISQIPHLKGIYLKI